MSSTAAYPAAPQPAGTDAPQPAVAPSPQAAPSNALGITSLVLGLVSIVGGWTFLAPVAGLVVGILALGREPQNRTMAIWGIVLNAVMLAGFVVLAILALVVGIAVLPFIPELSNL